MRLAPVSSLYLILFYNSLINDKKTKININIPLKSKTFLSSPSACDSLQLVSGANCRPTHTSPADSLSQNRGSSQNRDSSENRGTTG